MRNVVEKGTKWFRRFVDDAEKLSSHLVFKRIKYGFYRIYWINGGEPAYIGECYKEMPEHGYDIEDLDQRIEDRSYYEEFEDNVKMTRTIKNFVEGYWDNIERLRTKIYLLKNNKEISDEATKAYRTLVVK